MDSRKTLYIIMPVASDPASGEKRRIIEDVAEAEGFNVRFPMDRLHLSGSQDSLSSTLTELQQSDLVLADLTFERPSCYYELGLAEAVGANVAIVARIGTDIHQAASRHQVRNYSSLKDYRDVLACLVGE